MWSKFISPTGKLVLTKREVMDMDVKETSFWFDPSDKDYDKGVALAERLGL
jgi:hypothetical protein